MCASRDAATKLTDKMANAIRSSTAREKSGAPQKNVQVAYMAMCTRNRNAWMTETKIGILARTLEEERAMDCDAARNSGVLDSDTSVRCASGGYDTHGDHEFWSWATKPPL